MAKKEKEEIIELTEVVEEGEALEQREKEEEIDLDKELDELLDGNGETSPEAGDSMEKELDALLETNKDSTSKGPGEENKKEEDIDLDSIFDELDKDLSLDEEGENNTGSPPSPSPPPSSGPVSQDDIDKLLDPTEEEDLQEEEQTAPQEDKKTPGVPTQEDIDALFEEDENDEEKPEPTPQQKISQQDIQEHSISPISEEIEDIKGILHSIEEKLIALEGSIKNISSKIDTLSEDKGNYIKNSFKELKEDLLKNLKILIPQEAAKVVKEEIKALEEEIEAQED